MRVVHAATFTAAAMLLASLASAQGLGDTAAREREKRKTAAKPAKVFTDSDLSGAGADATAPASDQTGASDSSASGKPGATPADGKAKADADPEKAAAEERAKAEQAWKARLEDARKEEQIYKDAVENAQLDLNNTGGLYSSGRARQIAFLEESKKKLAEIQSRIAALEDEGRRSGYR